MKSIQLTQGKVALVDDADYDRLSMHRWHLSVHGRSSYAARYCRKGNKDSTVLMHREILGSSVYMVDHIDGDGLNNQRNNLRPCSRFGNAQNVRKMLDGHNYTSKYKGVSLSSNAKRNKRWMSMISSRGVHYFLGYYKTQNEAAVAYNEASLKYHKEYSRPNVIDSSVV